MTWMKYSEVQQKYVLILNVGTVLLVWNLSEFGTDWGATQIVRSRRIIEPPQINESFSIFHGISCTMASKE